MYKAYDIPITILRPFNTYGPRQSMRAIIPTIIAQLVQNPNKPLKLGNINSARDFVYVDDTVNALIKVALRGENGEVYNVANGKSFTIKQIIKYVEKYLKVKSKIQIDKSRFRKSDVFNLIGNNKKIKKIGWKAKYSGSTGFNKGLINTISWIKDNNTTYYNSSKYYL